MIPGLLAAPRPKDLWIDTLLPDKEAFAFFLLGTTTIRQKAPQTLWSAWGFGSRGTFFMAKWMPVGRRTKFLWPVLLLISIPLSQRKETKSLCPLPQSIHTPIMNYIRENAFSPQHTVLRPALAIGFHRKAQRPKFWQTLLWETLLLATDKKLLLLDPGRWGAHFYKFFLLPVLNLKQNPLLQEFNKHTQK